MFTACMLRDFCVVNAFVSLHASKSTASRNNLVIFQDISAQCNLIFLHRKTNCINYIISSGHMIGGYLLSFCLYDFGCIVTYFELISIGLYVN